MTTMSVPMAALIDLSDDPHDRMVIAAGIDLLDRSAGTDLTVGDDAGRWFAHVQYVGARLIVERHPSAAAAVDALARHALAGARCKCGRLIGPDAGPTVASGEPPPAGRDFTATTTAQVGVCRWRRFATEWIGACEAPTGNRPDWEPMDPVEPPPDGVQCWSSLLLADALDIAGAPARMVALAASGYWHIYRSPHERPELVLLHALTAAGVDGFADRVIAGEFAAPPAERLPGQCVLAVPGWDETGLLVRSIPGPGEPPA